MMDFLTVEDSPQLAAESFNGMVNAMKSNLAFNVSRNRVCLGLCRIIM